MVNKSLNIEQKFRVIKQLVSISLRVDTRVHVSSSHLRINLATRLSKCSHTQVLGRPETVKSQESLESRYQRQKIYICKDGVS